MTPLSILMLTDLEKKSIPDIDFEDEDIDSMNELCPDSDPLCEIKRLNMLFKVYISEGQVLNLLNNWS